MDAVMDLIRAQGDYTVAAEDVQQSSGASTGALLALAESAGLSTDEIRWLLDMVNQLNNTPVNPILVQYIIDVTGDEPPIPGPVPGLAGGGPVMANMPYVVGEEGPELFVPDAAGQIMSNSEFIGGAGVVPAATQTIVVNMNGNVLTERSFQDLVQEALLRIQRRNRTTGIV
jgi:hypothetical protein